MKLPDEPINTDHTRLRKAQADAARMALVLEAIVARASGDERHPAIQELGCVFAQPIDDIRLWASTCLLKIQTGS